MKIQFFQKEKDDDANCTANNCCCDMFKNGDGTHDEFHLFIVYRVLTPFFYRHKGYGGWK